MQSSRWQKLGAMDDVAFEARTAVKISDFSDFTLQANALQ
jgi:hypothetical protein